MRHRRRGKGHPSAGGVSPDLENDIPPQEVYPPDLENGIPSWEVYPYSQKGEAVEPPIEEESYSRKDHRLQGSMSQQNREQPVSCPCTLLVG